MSMDVFVTQEYRLVVFWWISTLVRPETVETVSIGFAGNQDGLRGPSRQNQGLERPALRYQCICNIVAAP